MVYPRKKTLLVILYATTFIKYATSEDLQHPSINPDGCDKEILRPTRYLQDQMTKEGIKDNIKHITCIVNNDHIFDLIHDTKDHSQGNDVIVTFYLLKNGVYTKTDVVSVDIEEFDHVIMKYDGWILIGEDHDLYNAENVPENGLVGKTSERNKVDEDLVCNNDVQSICPPHIHTSVHNLIDDDDLNTPEEVHESDINAFDEDAVCNNDKKYTDTDYNISRPVLNQPSPQLPKGYYDVFIQPDWFTSDVKIDTNIKKANVTYGTFDASDGKSKMYFVNCNSGHKIDNNGGLDVFVDIKDSVDNGINTIDITDSQTGVSEEVKDSINDTIVSETVNNIDCNIDGDESTLIQDNKPADNFAAYNIILNIEDTEHNCINAILEENKVDMNDNVGNNNKKFGYQNQINDQEGAENNEVSLNSDKPDNFTVITPSKEEEETSAKLKPSIVYINSKFMNNGLKDLDHNNVNDINIETPISKPERNIEGICTEAKCVYTHKDDNYNIVSHNFNAINASRNDNSLGNHELAIVNHINEITPKEDISTEKIDVNNVESTLDSNVNSVPKVNGIDVSQSSFNNYSTALPEESTSFTVDIASNYVYESNEAPINLHNNPIVAAEEDSNNHNHLTSNNMCAVDVSDSFTPIKMNNNSLQEKINILDTISNIQTNIDTNASLLKSYNVDPYSKLKSQTNDTYNISEMYAKDKQSNIETPFNVWYENKINPVGNTKENADINVCAETNKDINMTNDPKNSIKTNPKYEYMDVTSKPGYKNYNLSLEHHPSISVQIPIETTPNQDSIEYVSPRPIISNSESTISMTIPNPILTQNTNPFEMVSQQPIPIAELFPSKSSHSIIPDVTLYNSRAITNTKPIPSLKSRPNFNDGELSTPKSGSIWVTPDLSPLKSVITPISFANRPGPLFSSSRQSVSNSVLSRSPIINVKPLENNILSTSSWPSSKLELPAHNVNKPTSAQFSSIGPLTYMIPQIDESLSQVKPEFKYLVNKRPINIMDQDSKLYPKSYNDYQNHLSDIANPSSPISLSPKSLNNYEFYLPNIKTQNDKFSPFHLSVNPKAVYKQKPTDSTVKSSLLELKPKISDYKNDNFKYYHLNAINTMPLSKVYDDNNNILCPTPNILTNSYKNQQIIANLGKPNTIPLMTYLKSDEILTKKKQPLQYEFVINPPCIEKSPVPSGGALNTLSYYKDTKNIPLSTNTVALYRPAYQEWKSAANIEDVQGLVNKDNKNIIISTPSNMEIKEPDDTRSKNNQYTKPIEVSEYMNQEKISEFNKQPLNLNIKFDCNQPKAETNYYDNQNIDRLILQRLNYKSKHNQVDNNIKTSLPNSFTNNVPIEKYIGIKHNDGINPITKNNEMTSLHASKGTFDPNLNSKNPNIPLQDTETNVVINPYFKLNSSQSNKITISTIPLVKNQVWPNLLPATFNIQQNIEPLISVFTTDIPVGVNKSGNLELPLIKGNENKPIYCDNVSKLTDIFYAPLNKDVLVAKQNKIPNIPMSYEIKEDINKPNIYSSSVKTKPNTYASEQLDYETQKPDLDNLMSNTKSSLFGIPKTEKFKSEFNAYPSFINKDNTTPSNYNTVPTTVSESKVKYPIYHIPAQLINIPENCGTIPTHTTSNYPLSLIVSPKHFHSQAQTFNTETPSNLEQLSSSNLVQYDTNAIPRLYPPNSVPESLKIFNSYPKYGDSLTSTTKPKPMYIFNSVTAPITNFNKADEDSIRIPYPTTVTDSYSSTKNRLLPDTDLTLGLPLCEKGYHWQPPASNKREITPPCSVLPSPYSWLPLHDLPDPINPCKPVINNKDTRNLDRTHFKTNFFKLSPKSAINPDTEQGFYDTTIVPASKASISPYTCNSDLTSTRNYDTISKSYGATIVPSYTACNSPYRLNSVSVPSRVVKVGTSVNPTLSTSMATSNVNNKTEIDDTTNPITLTTTLIESPHNLVTAVKDDGLTTIPMNTVSIARPYNTIMKPFSDIKSKPESYVKYTNCIHSAPNPYKSIPETVMKETIPLNNKIPMPLHATGPSNSNTNTVSSIPYSIKPISITTSNHKFTELPSNFDEIPRNCNTKTTTSISNNPYCFKSNSYYTTYGTKLPTSTEYLTDFSLKAPSILTDPSYSTKPTNNVPVSTIHLSILPNNSIKYTNIPNPAMSTSNPYYNNITPVSFENTNNIQAICTKHDTILNPATSNTRFPMPSSITTVNTPIHQSPINLSTLLRKSSRYTNIANPSILHSNTIFTYSKDPSNLNEPNTEFRGEFTNMLSNNPYFLNINPQLPTQSTSLLNRVFPTCNSRNPTYSNIPTINITHSPNKFNALPNSSSTRYSNILNSEISTNDSENIYSSDSIANLFPLPPTNMNPSMSTTNSRESSYSSGNVNIPKPLSSSLLSSFSYNPIMHAGFSEASPKPIFNSMLPISVSSTQVVAPSSGESLKTSTSSNNDPSSKCYSLFNEKLPETIISDNFASSKQFFSPPRGELIQTPTKSNSVSNSNQISSMPSEISFQTPISSNYATISNEIHDPYIIKASPLHSSISSNVASSKQTFSPISKQLYQAPTSKYETVSQPIVSPSNGLLLQIPTTNNYATYSNQMFTPNIPLVPPVSTANSKYDTVHKQDISPCSREISQTPTISNYVSSSKQIFSALREQLIQSPTSNYATSPREELQQNPIRKNNLEMAPLILGMPENTCYPKLNSNSMFQSSIPNDNSDLTTQQIAYPNLDCNLQSQSSFLNDLTFSPNTFKTDLNKIQNTCYTNSDSNLTTQSSISNDPSPAIPNDLAISENKLKIDLRNYINNILKANSYKQLDLAIPLDNIVITNPQSNITKINNPEFSLTMWDSNFKIVEAKLSLKFKDFSVNNFMPLVSSSSECNLNTVRDFAKGYVAKNYGQYLLANVPYSANNEWAIINNSNCYNNCNILWPEYYY